MRMIGGKFSCPGTSNPRISGNTTSGDGHSPYLPNMVSSQADTLATAWAFVGKPTAHKTLPN